jgi:nucleoside phosphorylase
LQRFRFLSASRSAKTEHAKPEKNQEDKAMAERAFTPSHHVNVEDLRLNYDPEAPQERFKAAGVEAAFLSESERLPSMVPWPAATKPTPKPLKAAPSESADLTKFKGYDAVVVTWTSAEAAALAALFTPGFPVSQWYEYRHNVESYIPLVTGGVAPFNDKTADMARYYHSLGLYFPCSIGKARVLLMKSGLHLDYDGPKYPVQKMITEVVQAVQPKLFITTGTGGGIGKSVELGDVIIAGHTKFHCVTQFKNEPWATASYATSPIPAGTIEAITPKLTEVNAGRVSGGRSVPKMWDTAADAIVTTDFFGFDDSTNYYKLQGLGQACDMGDAMVGNAMQQFPKVKWHAIRNASDPQIANPSGKIEQAKQEAGQIYSKYGAFTTAASVIATWAVIQASFGH